MKKFSSALILVGVVLTAGIITKSALAATTAVVNATVTAQNVSVTVGNGTIAYGFIAADSSRGTATMLGSTQSATNSGNVAEDFTIHGQNSTSWTLDSTNTTPDHYIHRFCTASCGTPPTNYTALTTGETSLASNVSAAGGTQSFDLYLTTPQTSSVYVSQTVDVTVTATAH